MFSGKDVSYSHLYLWFILEVNLQRVMATNSNRMDTGQEGLAGIPSQVVAIYRFVIVDGKACIDDNPEQGIWISKDTTGKEFTYTAYLARKDWKASFGCVYSHAGVFRAVKILEINDILKKVIDWEPGDKEGRNLERGLSNEASGIVDKQIEELGKKPSWSMILETPIKSRGGTKDDNDNDLLRFDLWNYPLGINGDCKEHMALWWAKKETSGRPITVLSGPELEMSKLEGKIA